MSRGSYARVYTQRTPNARYVTEASFELNSFRRDKRPPFKFMPYFARSGQRSSAYRTENARIVDTGIGIISIPFFLFATIRSLARSRRSSTGASNFVLPRRYPKQKKKKIKRSCDVSAERKNCNRLAIRKPRANVFHVSGKTILVPRDLRFDVPYRYRRRCETFVRYVGRSFPMEL